MLAVAVAGAAVEAGAADEAGRRPFDARAPARRDTAYVVRHRPRARAHLLALLQGDAQVTAGEANLNLDMIAFYKK